MKKPAVPASKKETTIIASCNQGDQRARFPWPRRDCTVSFPGSLSSSMGKYDGEWLVRSNFNIAEMDLVHGELTGLHEKRDFLRRMIIQRRSITADS